MFQFKQYQGRSQDFSKGGGGRGRSHCVIVRVLTRLSCRFRHLLWVVCLKKGLQKGRSQAPQDPFLATPLSITSTIRL